MQNIVAIFRAPKMTAEQYDGIWDDLKAAGQSNPKGLISHVGFPAPEGGWMVVDVWESGEAFEAFGKETLMPILARFGSDVLPPQVIPAHFVHVPEKELQAG